MEGCDPEAMLKRKTRKRMWQMWRDGKIFETGWKKVLHTLRLGKFFIVQRTYYKVYAHYDPFSFWMWTHPKVTRADEVFVNTYVQAGDTIVDAGANVGIITLTAAHKTGLAGKVYAYEPHPETFTFLSRNIRLNNLKNVTAYNVGLGAQVENAKMLNSYTKDINYVTEQGKVDVELTTLDTHLRAPHIDLLKIDVEGYELFVLQGGAQTLKNTQCVLVEFSPKTYERHGYTFADVYTLLYCAGFATYDMVPDQTLVPVNAYYTTNQKYRNIIALRDVDEYNRRMGL